MPVAAGLGFPSAAGTAFADPSGMSLTLNSRRRSNPAPQDFASDEDLLDDLRRRTFRYFIEGADVKTGLIADRGRTSGKDFSGVASSAACGFGLAALSVAAEDNLISRGEAADRTRLMLRSLLSLAQHHRGFVYHFFGMRDGRRRWRCDASSIDTALMLAGAMCASTSFADDPEIVESAEALIRRVDWSAMLDSAGVLHMGWTPESGRLPYRWDHFSEHTIMVMLAIGSGSNGIAAECWNAWRRDRELTHLGESFLSYPPLFVHQYPQAFFDFRQLRAPSGREFWRNSQIAHHAQIEFMKGLGEKYPERFAHYGHDLWGLTSSDSSTGYRDWGGPYEDGRVEPDRGIDGTVVPSAAGGGLAIVPEESLRTLRYQHREFGDRIYGRYGFANAFNPATGWVAADVIGIDTGITYLMAENLRTGSVWKNFMKHSVAQQALSRIGFTRIRQV